jgi:hypothetical protein
MVQDGPAMGFVTSGLKIFRRNWFATAHGAAENASIDLVSDEPDGKNTLPPMRLPQTPNPGYPTRENFGKAGQCAFNAAAIFQSIFKQ